MSGAATFNLWRNGIFIDRDDPPKAGFPPHVDALRSALLDYGCDIPENLEPASFTDEYRRLNEIARALGAYDGERDAFEFNPIELRATKQQAETLDKEGDRDCDWEPFFLDHFLNRLIYMRGEPDDEVEGLDASFHYYTDVLKRAGIQENLSYGALQHLAQHGLEPDASCVLASETKESYLDREGICFPWLIVQHAKAGEAEIRCYHDAANAATAAVMMLERLCELVPRGIRGKANEHVPPVLVITTARKIVRVWIAYSRRPSVEDVAKFRMVCIWKGDMTVMLDLMKFPAILCNAHRWAVRDQRPRILGFIDLWRAYHPMGSSSAAEKQEPKPSITKGTGSNHSPLDDMEPRDRDRLLDLLESYQEILKDERRGREKLTAQVDRMQQRLRDFIEGGDSRSRSLSLEPAQETGQEPCPAGRSSATTPTPTPPQARSATVRNLSSSAPQPAQKTGSQKPSSGERPTATTSTPVPPPPQSTPVLTSSIFHRRILPLKKTTAVPVRQQTMPLPLSSGRPEIFERGIQVHWAKHPGRYIRVRLPKPPPTVPEAAGQKALVAENIPKFDFAMPLHWKKPPAFNFGFVTPFHKSTEGIFGSTSVPSSAPPAKKLDAPLLPCPLPSTSSTTTGTEKPGSPGPALPSTSPKPDSKTPPRSNPGPPSAGPSNPVAGVAAPPTLRWQSPSSSEAEEEDGVDEDNTEGQPTSSPPQPSTTTTIATAVTTTVAVLETAINQGSQSAQTTRHGNDTAVDPARGPSPASEPARGKPGQKAEGESETGREAEAERLLWPDGVDDVSLGDEYDEERSYYGGDEDE